MDADRYPDTEFCGSRRTRGRHGYVAYFPRSIPRRIEISSSNLRRLADVGVVTEAADGPRRQLRWRAHEVISILSEHG